MFRFTGFTLDRQRASLLGPDGGTIKLRPKTFDMLCLFAENPRRVISKQELMAAIWPNVRIGEDGLFQCIREIRAALGDEDRTLVKLVSGRGYIFEADVSAGLTDTQPAPEAARTATPDGPTAATQTPPTAEPAPTQLFRQPKRLPLTLVPVFGLGAFAAIAIPFLSPRLSPQPALPSIMVMPINVATSNGAAEKIATGATDRLIDGLARIDGIRVVLPPKTTADRKATTTNQQADYVVNADLRDRDHAWTLETRLIQTATGTVVPIESPAVEVDDADPQLTQSRLAAALGHPLALRLNELLDSGPRPTSAAQDTTQGAAKVVIGQAIASINQTSRERFSAAQTMLEKALADDRDNADLAIALASLQLRGIQLVWYSPADAAVAETKAKSTLEHALKNRPAYIPALEAYCRFLATTNQFVSSLVACARVLSFDPWNGLALYHTGLVQVQLGRFDDALNAFKQADRYDTPQVSRWTWLLGAGLTLAVMHRYEDAVPWLKRSLAITPGSGRTFMLLAAAYQRLGHTAEAKAALAQGMQLRPGSTAKNISLPTKNASPVFLDAAKDIKNALVEIGLPER
ncbi:MAG: tetratricopeptide repeat protein [Rhodopseudomonas sp.]|nr:tetratricopeptide repeat protein [Rhodopseudomonas sp.]